MSFQKILVTLAMLSMLIGAVPLHAAAIDSTLYTYYNIGTDLTGISLTVCGSLPDSDGCYGSGSMGPFGRVGSMIEGNPAQNVKKGTVTRYIYVVDVASGSGGDGVELYVYKKVDTISGSDDSVAVTLYKTISLTELTGRNTATAFLAANTKFLFVGTNQNGNVVSVTKTDLDVSTVSETSEALSSITANGYGDISLVWGTGEGAVFEIITPSGKGGVAGAPASFLQNTTQGAVPSMLP
ncbi:MAG: hypothetical protein WBE45_05550 [Terriglobales bacterium]